MPLYKVTKETFAQDYIRAEHGYNLGKLTPAYDGGGVRDNSEVFLKGGTATSAKSFLNMCDLLHALRAVNHPLLNFPQVFEGIMTEFFLGRSIERPYRER